LQIKTKIVSSDTADSKPVKQEVNGTVILPPLVFPACGICIIYWLVDKYGNLPIFIFSLHGFICQRQDIYLTLGLAHDAFYHQWNKTSKKANNCSNAVFTYSLQKSDGSKIYSEFK